MRNALLYGALILASIINPAVCHSKTASELTALARNLGRDPSATGRVRFTDAQILDFINEGQRDSVASTFCILKEYTFDTVQGTVFYSLPTDYIRIDRLISDDVRLEEKSVLKLDQEYTEWEANVGIPTAYYINFASRTKVGFYPYPGSVTSTTTVKVEYYAQVTDMTASSTPFNSITEFTPFHQMLAYYAAAQMLYIDGFSNSADRYLQRYVSYKTEFAGYCRNKTILLDKLATK